MNVKDKRPNVCFLFFQTMPKRWQASSTRQHMNHNNCFYNYTVNSANNRDVLEWETDEFHELSGRSVPPPTLRVCGYFYCDVAVCSAAELSSRCCWWNLRIFVDDLSERSCGLLSFCWCCGNINKDGFQEFLWMFTCVTEKMNGYCVLLHQISACKLVLHDQNLSSQTWHIIQNNNI